MEFFAAAQHRANDRVDASRRDFLRRAPLAAGGAALAATGALTLADTARLLRLRGQSMQRAVPKGNGAMELSQVIRCFGNRGKHFLLLKGRQ